MVEVYQCFYPVYQSDAKPESSSDWLITIFDVVLSEFDATESYVKVDHYESLTVNKLKFSGLPSEPKLVPHLLTNAQCSLFARILRGGLTPRGGTPTCK